MSYLNKRLILQSAVAHDCKNAEEVFLAFFIYFVGLILRIDDSVVQQTISGTRLLERLLQA